MRTRFRFLRRFGEAEAAVFAGLVLMTLYWVFDSVHDIRVSRQMEAPSGHHLLTDLLTFSLQLFLILLAWQLFSRRRQLEAKLEEAVRRSTEEKNRSEAIIAALGDGISIQDRDFRVVYQNQTHQRMVCGDFQGEICFRAYARQDQVCGDCPVRQAFEDGEVHRLEKRNSQGRPSTHIEIVASPLRDAQGQIVAGIEMVRDISRRKQEEEMLRQKTLELAASNQELEAFSYSLSHDLRNPLTRIYAAAQALEESPAVQARESERFLARTICEGSERMEELIEAMLALSRVLREPMRRESVDLSLLAEGIAAQLLLLDMGRRAEFVVAPGLSAQGDPRLLQVALENLLENAWKYTSATPLARIEVGKVEKEGATTFFVRDNGVGFDLAQAGRLFKPFERLHPPGDYAGTGIGLATVQRVIHRHGGKVWAESAPAEGTTFFFILP